MTGMRLALTIAGAAFFCVAGGCCAPGAARAQERLPAEVVLQLQHVDSIETAALSPDGRFVLSAGDNTLKLWDGATGRQLRSIRAHSGGVFCVAFSPDGRFAVSGGGDKLLKLWDIATGKEVRRFQGHAGWLHNVAFAADGRSILSGGLDKNLKLWDVATGKELRNFGPHPDTVDAAAISPDGRFALSAGGKNTVNQWDLATGKLARSFNGFGPLAFSPDGRFILSGDNDAVRLREAATGNVVQSFDGISPAAFSPDGRFVVLGARFSDAALKLWDVAAGKELQSYKGPQVLASVAFSPDGRTMLTASRDKTLQLWDAPTGKELRSFTGRASSKATGAFSPDGRFAITGGQDEALKLWDLTTGKQLRIFSPPVEGGLHVVFSPDGRFVLSDGADAIPKLQETLTGKVVQTFKGHAEPILSRAFSSDGRFVLTGDADKSLKMWDAATGKELRSFKGHEQGVSSAAFSPDGSLVVSTGVDQTVRLWEAATGKQLKSFEAANQGGMTAMFSPDGRHVLGNSCDRGDASCAEASLKLWEVSTGRQALKFAAQNDNFSAFAFSPDGRYVIADSPDFTLDLWETGTGRLVRRFHGHVAAVRSIAFSPDGRLIFSGSEDGATRVWEAQGGRELARMMSTPEGEWLTMTPEGFFSASHRDTGMLAVVRGFDATTIGQVHQSLFNPDLVREALAGDPGGEVKRAAEVINLTKVLDSGPAPAAAIVLAADGVHSSEPLVPVTARIADRGKGVGRIEWRVNGLTVGVMAAPPGAGPEFEVRRMLALDRGENKIEVIAYEARNLLASPPARALIGYGGVGDGAKPRLHILAVGVNAYVDRGAPRGDFGSFPPLNLAVADAKAFAAEMKKAAAGRYADVQVWEALDAGATVRSLHRTIDRIAAEINPHDTFVLYAAGHGFSKDGRFYLIPQDYQGGTDPDALASRAIGQERLQDWIANRISARKVLMLFDTCKSGALVAGASKSRVDALASEKSRVDAPASEAAVGRLHEATGRPVLTAAASGKPAFEGYEGHGVFTFALLDALRNGDSNGNGAIELSELVAHVESLVPRLSAELGGRGLAVATATHGFDDKRQSAHFGSTGEDFVVVGRLP